jgi:hypothetical protein
VLQAKQNLLAYTLYVMASKQKKNATTTCLLSGLAAQVLNGGKDVPV